MQSIDSQIDNYYRWLKDKTQIKSVNDWVRGNVPILDRNNDYIQLYIKNSNGEYELSDGGDTINGLIDEGCDFTSKRKKVLNLIMNGYAISVVGNVLQTTANNNNFALKKHSLIQAILSVNDMMYLSSPHVTSIFYDDIKQCFPDSEIRFSEQISFTGKTGYIRKFDFLIPRSKYQPERIIKTINHPSRQSADSAVMDWIDTKDNRPDESKSYALLNDSTKAVSKSVIESLKSYQITPVEWSKRDKFKKRACRLE